MRFTFTHNANKVTIAGSNLLQASASLAASGRAATLKSSGNFCWDDYNLREVKSDDGKKL
ncbi:hypothetical protein C7B76_30990 [filamentous cyanobacterium CCP2]|nr:hypothetical protein C7B76_30990 [filamentous cyanobacterium CCP2]